MNKYSKIAVSTILIALTFSIGIANCQSVALPSPESVPALHAQISNFQQKQGNIRSNLRTFDALEYEVYSMQDWNRMDESHSSNVLVHYPGGHSTIGLTEHISELKGMFEFAPNAYVIERPVSFGQGSWTGTIGILEGDFTVPMPIGDGTSIRATGKHFKLNITKIGHWNEAGFIDEEYLYWDNQEFVKQIGLVE